MKLVPIQKQRVSHQIIEQIKMSLERGELKPGDRLPSERDMAERLSVSRSAVREAFSVLEASRIIRVQPGVGVFLETDPGQEIVKKLQDIVQPADTRKQMVDLLEVRQAIESQAAYLAATRRSERDLANIRASCEKLAASVEAGLLAAEEDLQFHLAIVEAAQNPMLLEAARLFLDSTLDGLQMSRSESMRVAGRSREVLKEHELILTAIEQKDAERAQQAMWDHLTRVKARYLSTQAP